MQPFLRIPSRKEGVHLIRMRLGVFSSSDEQMGSSSQSTVTQTNTDQDEKQDLMDEGENVEYKERGGCQGRRSFIPLSRFIRSRHPTPFLDPSLYGPSGTC